MRPIATDGVALSVCVSVCLFVTFVSPAKNGWTDRDAIQRADPCGPKESCIRRRYTHTLHEMRPFATNVARSVVCVCLSVCWWWTSSPAGDDPTLPGVVRECKQNFHFLPIESQLEIRTAKFLQTFSATKNTLCLLFKQRAVTQLDGIFGKYKPNVIRSASQLVRTLRCK